MQSTPVDVARMTQHEPRYLNINEASKACGLSPSVLRIWELRYGWPNPKRRANGYRAYSPHLVDDLKHMSKLVKSGMPIRQCIEDGMPKWPIDETQRRPRTIDQTKALPAPGNSEAALLQRNLIEAMERHQTGLLREFLERVTWSARPDDEALTAHLPVVIGIAELRHVGRPLGQVEASIMHWVTTRAVQLMRRYRCDGERLHVLPSGTQHTTLACVAALLLRQHGVQAEPWLGQGRPRGRIVIAGDGDAVDGEDTRVLALRTEHDDAENSVTLAEMLDGARAIAI